MHFVEAKSLLTSWNGMNVYRGCAHGCIYCDSRSTCYQFKHPFEDIEVKENAPQLLEDILRRKRKKIMISSGSMADPYQPCCRSRADVWSFWTSMNLARRSSRNQTLFCGILICLKALIANRRQCCKCR